MKILYRISDGSHNKEKLYNGDKFISLENALDIFGTEDFYIFADNCKPETIEKIKGLGLEPRETSLGNSNSWRHIVEFAIKNFKKNAAVYLLEDDYLHKPGAKQALAEGLEIADYVTLYDNPDKYWKGAHGEATRAFRTENFHWKLTSSTTMTFATHVKTLIADKKTWWKHTHKWSEEHQRYIPDDFAAWTMLTGRYPGRKATLKNIFRKLKSPHRTLISSIPGLSTHTELAYLAPGWEE